jgi:hypothetical protein
MGKGQKSKTEDLAFVFAFLRRPRHLGFVFDFVYDFVTLTLAVGFVF